MATETTEIRALVADDNAVNRLVAQQCLINLGCNVVICENGQEAVELASKGGFDIVFMDCHMPIMDGYAASRAIRQLPGVTREIPIVALTANALTGDRAASLAAGMNDHLPKPFRPHEVQRVLNQLVRALKVEG